MSRDHSCQLIIMEPQLAAEAEAAKARVEGDLLQTAKIASSMEARLRESQAAADAARSSAATADRRAYEVKRQPRDVLHAHGTPIIVHGLRKCTVLLAT